MPTTAFLRGDEHVLDMSCGRSTVLAMIAKQLLHGGAVGLDLWRREGQPGSSLDAARKNLDAERVRDGSELRPALLKSTRWRWCGLFNEIRSVVVVHPKVLFRD